MDKNKNENGDHKSCSPEIPVFKMFYSYMNLKFFSAVRVLPTKHPLWANVSSFRRVFSSKLPFMWNTTLSFVTLNVSMLSSERSTSA